MWALKREALERIWVATGDRSPRRTIRCSTPSPRSRPRSRCTAVRGPLAGGPAPPGRAGAGPTSWPATPTGWPSTGGSSDWSTGSWRRRSRPSRSSTTSPSAPIPRASTPGTGRTCSSSTAPGSARRPTSSTRSGQDWGLPPMDPWRLRAAGYEPFVRMLRSALAHGSGLRIDHVMGLFRLFWIPPGGRPAAGLYVRQPADELLALVALESQRAQGFVVGEDLGTVEPGVREVLAEHRVLSYRVMALDDTPVEHYPVEALASVHHPRPADARRVLVGRRPRRPGAARHGAERRRHPRGQGPLRAADRRRRRTPLDEVARRRTSRWPVPRAASWWPSSRTRRAWRSGRTCRARPTAGPTGAWRCPSRSRPCWTAR